MTCGRVMIAAAKSGSGKTVITCGLLAWLKEHSCDVRSYKCGPDYIDPMFHRQVIGIPGGNLDTFYSDPDAIRRQIAESQCDVAVMEGVMGLYDGIPGISGRGSCYDVARVTGTSVVLVLDVKGMGYTMISLIKGLLLEDTACLIRGFVLNRISPGYYEDIKPLIEKALRDISEKRGTKTEILGGIPPLKDLQLDCRHLGLVMPEEIDHLREKVAAVKRAIDEHINTDRLLQIIAEADEIKAEPEACPARRISGPEVTLAVARDEAFCFYYEENMKILEQQGIRVVPFSPLHDCCLPDDASGLLLGGGYPELHASRLSHNKSMRESIRTAIKSGMPYLAECGGFMYLLDQLTDMDGNNYAMCGVFRGSSQNTGKLGRFGYVTIRENGSSPTILRGLSVRGHEFHYYDSDNNGSDATAVKPGNKRTWECIHARSVFLAGFPHLYYPSCPDLIARFKQAMQDYQQENPGR